MRHAFRETVNAIYYGKMILNMVVKPNRFASKEPSDVKITTRDIYNVLHNDQDLF